MELSAMQKRTLLFCNTARKRDEIMEYLGLKDRMNAYSRVIKPLLAQGLLAMTCPDTPRSPRQKYVSRSDNSAV